MSCAIGTIGSLETATLCSTTTGRRVRIGGLILDRVDDGKVIERWELWDQMGMLQQLGLA